MPAALWCSPCPQPPAAPPLTQLRAVPSGPVAVTQSRAQCCLSVPCEELQPPWGLPSAPLLWAEQIQGRQLPRMHLCLSTCHHLCSPPLDNLLIVSCPSYIVAPKQHPVLQARPHQCRGESTTPTLSQWQHWAWCTLGCSCPFGLPGHSAGLDSACCHPELPDRFLIIPPLCMYEVCSES